MTIVYLVYRPNLDVWLQNKTVVGVFDSSEKAHAYIKQDTELQHIDPELYQVMGWKVN